MCSKRGRGLRAGCPTAKEEIGQYTNPYKGQSHAVRTIDQGAFQHGGS
jgi:hypothetical protein